jgi:hypothetical protein
LRPGTLRKLLREAKAITAATQSLLMFPLVRLTCPSLCVPGAPVVFYQEGIHDTCVFSSMAAALYFAGAKKAANKIQNAAPGMVGCNVQSMFHSLVRKIRTTEVKFLLVSKLYPSFDWKNDLKDNMILVGSLEGSNGSVHHVVTLICGWLFDSNETQALPLTKQALDFCTQAEEEMTMTGCASTFCRFRHGTIYTNTMAKQKLKYISASSSTPKSPNVNKTLLYNFIRPRSHVESRHLLTAGLVACLIGFVVSRV